MTTDKLVITAVMVIMVMGVGVAKFNSGGSASTSSPSAEPAQSVDQPAAKYALRTTPVRIDWIASAPYTRAEYPTTFAKFGKNVPSINADRIKAAEIASVHADCDAVTNSQIATQSPFQNRRYWVECANLTRLYFDQESLSANEPVDLQTKADWLRDGLKNW